VSVIGVLCKIALVASSAAVWALRDRDGELPPSSEYDVVRVTKDVLNVVPILLFSYAAHFNAFAIFSELENPTLERCRATVVAGFTPSTIMYASMVFGYLAYGQATCGNLFNNYESDLWIDIIQIAYCTSLLLTFPIVHFELSNNLKSLLRLGPSMATHVALSAAAVLSITLLAVYAPSLDFVFGLVGSTTGMLIAYILPAVFHIQLRTGRYLDWRREPGASALLVFGIVGGIMALVVVGLNADGGEPEGCS